MKKETKLVRVTSVLGWVESAWKEWWFRKVGFEEADKISRESAKFGTKVHELIGEMLLGGIPPEAAVWDGAASLCASAVVDYLEKNQIEPLFDNYHNSLEVEVLDRKLGLVGHFDYAALVSGVPTIIDFKTSNKMRKSFPLQKAAYAKMANKQFGVKINKGMTIRSHWNKEKETVEIEVKDYDNLIKKYWPKFRDCYSVYRYFNYK